MVRYCRCAIAMRSSRSRRSPAACVNPEPTRRKHAEPPPTSRFRHSTIKTAQWIHRHRRTADSPCRLSPMLWRWWFRVHWLPERSAIPGHPAARGWGAWRQKKARICLTFRLRSLSYSQPARAGALWQLRRLKETSFPTARAGIARARSRPRAHKRTSRVQARRCATAKVKQAFMACKKGKGGDQDVPGSMVRSS
jgi:hypothetical protein